MTPDPTVLDSPPLGSRPLAEELPTSLTPWQVCQRLAHLPHVLFLDSSSRLPELGRYSFVTADPFSWLTARGQAVHLDGVRLPDPDPFTVLQRELSRHQLDTVSGLPPFQGGAAGLLGYDLCHHIERLPRHRIDEFAAPEMAVGFYDWVIAFDHHLDRSWLLSTGLPETDPSRRRRRAEARSHEIRARLNFPPTSLHRATEPITPEIAHPLPGHPGVFSNFTKREFLDTIARAIEYVHAGDCFQVNVAQRLLHRLEASPLEVYGRLRDHNPAPFAGYFDLGDFAVASASPERFLRVENRHVETRPIKGTRPRGDTPEEELRRAQELLDSAKDRAENVMIVDLLRNDLGRVCTFGSIRVDAVCRLETYQYVHHLVSVVTGDLRPEKSLVDLLRAGFPGGSITGAPKVRAMQIIAELEPTARGPYCGSLAYLGFDGSMDSNLLIRTCTLGKGWLQLPVGGGIVADSTPQSEYDETLHKAEGTLLTSFGRTGKEA